MKYKFPTLVFLAVLTIFLSNAANVNAGCTANGPVWSPNPAPWINTASPRTFDFVQNYTTGNDPVADAATLTDSCIAGGTNGAKCQIVGISRTSYQDFDPCPENRAATYQSPVNRIDTVAPTCGTWSGSGPTFTLSGSTDTGNTGGDSGIKVAGGTCTATAGNSCSVPISDIAGNTKECISPIYENPAPSLSTINLIVVNGYPVGPSSKQVASGEKAIFYFGSSSTTTPVRSGDCPAGANPSYDPVNGYWFYTTGAITANCTVTMTFPTATFQVTPVVGSGGSISPSNTQTVSPGSTKSFSITPNSGYSFTVGGSCGGSPTTGSSAATYTTNSVFNDCTVSVSFSATPLPMTGTIDASDCNISAGYNSCNSTITWTTTNPEGSSSVTTPTNITVGTGLNNTAGYPVAYGSRTFYLYNNGKLLASDGASASCVAGTTWNGSVCEAVAPTLPDLTASYPTPSTATVNVPQTFSSVISNNGGVSTGASFYNFFQVASGANGSGTLNNLTASSTSTLAAYANRTVTSPAYTFTATGTYSVRACADKSNPTSSGAITEADENNNCSAWRNVVVSNSVGTVSGTHDAYTGTVPASQCRADGWAAYSSDKSLDLNVRILSDGVQVATGVAGTYRGDLETAGVCTGGTCGFFINLSGLITTGVNHTITAQAQNPGDSSWVTLASSPKTLNCGAGMAGTLTASNCTVKKGESSCNTSLSWTTSNPVGTSSITSNTPSSNTQIATGNSGSTTASVSYSSRTFFLYNNSTQLATATATASCATGTSWDGAKCVELTSPPSGPVCGNGIVESPETCDDGVNSGKCATSSCTTSCTINAMCGGGGALNGRCPTPATHYNCSVGASINNTNGISSWTWSCAGINGGTTASCVEMKKKPGYKEE